MFGLRRPLFYVLIITLATFALLHPYLIPGPYSSEHVATAPARVKAVFSLLAVLGLVVPHMTLQILFTRATRIIDHQHHAVHGMLKIQRLEMVSADQVRRGLLMASDGVRHSTNLVVWGLFVSRVLNLFPAAQPVADDIRLLIAGPLQTIAQALIDYLPNFIQIAIILLVTRYVLKAIHLFFHAVGAEIIVLPDFYPEWAEPTYKITRLLILAFIPFIIMPLLPIANSQLFEEISFLLGLLVSLGSTSAIKNMTAGAVLTYTRSFQIGDRVQIGDVTGDVVEKSLFVTRIHTVKNEQVAIPNGTVLESNIVNYSALARSSGLILHTTITIGYDVDWRLVQQLLIDAALATPDVQPQPRPFVLQNSLDDYYVTYEINAYTDQPQRIPATLSALHAMILDSFHTAGVEIMSPSYSALRNGNDAAIPPDLSHRALGPSPDAPIAVEFTALHATRAHAHADIPR